MRFDNIEWFTFLNINTNVDIIPIYVNVSFIIFYITSYSLLCIYYHYCTKYYSWKGILYIFHHSLPGISDKKFATSSLFLYICVVVKVRSAYLSQAWLTFVLYSRLFPPSPANFEKLLFVFQLKWPWTWKKTLDDLIFRNTVGYKRHKW